MGNPHQLSCPYFVHMILRTVKIPSNVEVMYKVFFERITMIQAKMEFDALEFAHGWDGRPWGCPETGHQQSGVRAPNHSDPGFHQHCLLRGIQGHQGPRYWGYVCGVRPLQGQVCCKQEDAGHILTDEDRRIFLGKIIVSEYPLIINQLF